MRQPTLFEKEGTPQALASAERVVLYALGDFQSRGKVLAGRDLPLDRLRGALRRASEAFGRDELTDEQAVSALTALGADVRRVPPFVAKHPFRVVVPLELAERARTAYQKAIAEVKRQREPSTATGSS
jgi:hypothetical protein